MNSKVGKVEEDNVQVGWEHFIYVCVRVNVCTASK